MDLESKKHYLEIAQADLARTEQEVGASREAHRANICDRSSMDTHLAIKADPYNTTLIENTIKFLIGCPPTSTIRSGAEFVYEATLNGAPDQKGTYLFFESTKDIPEIKRIEGLPNIITGISRMGKRFYGQTAGTTVSVSSEVDGESQIWEAKICKVE